MRNHVTHLATAVLVSAFAVACGGSHDYTSESGRASGSAQQNIKLDGCMAPAESGPGHYIVRNVVLPEPAEQPNGQQTAQQPPVTEGSWVNLVGDTDHLQGYLGQRVEVEGRITDTGANTMGTSGHAGTNEDKFARSSHDASTNPDRAITPTTAVPNGADANGWAPSLAVEHVKKLADSCESK